MSKFGYNISVHVLSGVVAKNLVDAFYQSVGSSHRARDEDTFFILMAEHKVIGTVRHCFENGVSLLRSMQIAPEHRGKQLGLLLLESFENFLTEQRISETYCLPYSHLPKFYGQIGFREISEAEAPKFLIDRLKDYRSNYKDKSYSVMRRSR